ncbi:MAG: hypothetical protein CVT96_04000 [Bacteroidetes bacterium HGW-Bacteroidetes-13]|nr:MAG: hypothetical protein CVT96_04000 [Bacteroidetes bacterium HGW-Bacteroidetes-13]
MDEVRSQEVRSNLSAGKFEENEKPKVERLTLSLSKGVQAANFESDRKAYQDAVRSSSEAYRDLFEVISEPLPKEIMKVTTNQQL